MKTWKLAIVASHVIQYHDPFFALLASNENLDVEVFYCSSAGAARYYDADMKTALEWDLPMLRGYRFEFLPNWSPLPISSGFFRFVNPAVLSRLQRARPDAILLMVGWATATSWITIAAAHVLGIPIILYGDSSFLPHTRGLRGRVRNAIVRALVRSAAAFGVSGTFNADYYLHHGADRRKFFAVPWAIDSRRFRETAKIDPAQRQAVRKSLGIDARRFVVLFSGKLIERKNPVHLIESVSRMKHRDRVTVVYLGEGAEREAIERAAQSRGVDVRVTGFRNQTELPPIIASSDCFVLPSSFDPRGTVTNEAMACGVPVVVSHRVGVWGAGDLVEHGVTGFVYETGDHEALAAILDRLEQDEDLRLRVGAAGRERESGWSYEAGVTGILQALRFIHTGIRPESQPRFVDGTTR